MKQSACILLIISFIGSSCVTLDITEIRNLEKVEFDALSLIPERETNDLRIDLIRQSYSENVNDSTTQTKETPYHPLGFDLGNGLFFDLSENFSFRIDYLLGFASDSNFELQKIYRPEKNKWNFVYSFINDSLMVTYPHRKKSQYIYHKKGNPDSTSYFYKNWMKYAIIENDTSLIYSGKKRQFEAIHKIDDTHYCVNIRKWKRDFQISGNEIFIERDYIVSLTNNNKTIEIKRQGIRKDRVLYFIERSKDKIYIYNENYFGQKIELNKNSLMIYQGNTLVTKYELKN